MINISPLQRKDCYKAALAHVAHLNTNFKTVGGIRLLQNYYEALTEETGGFGYVITVDDQFAGFVCGIWDRKAIRVIGFKKIPVLVFNGLRHVIEDPAFIVNMVNRLIQAKLVDDPIGGDTNDDDEGYELRPIVVLPEFRGQGLAEKLVERLINDARERGYSQIFLVTEYDNHAAIKFYSKFGFVLEGERSLHMGTTHATTAKLFRYYIDKT